MSDTRLLIDLGNSRVKWMWTVDREIDTDRAGRGGVDALASACRAGDAPRPGGVLIASVASAATTGIVTGLCAELWGLEAHLLRSRAEQGVVINGYTDPASLGVDRWLAIVGAVHRYGKPLVVWDLGTATTLDAVDAAGRHLGGWILPGPATMLDALRSDTQLRVPRDLRNAGPLQPGSSTAECIARGAQAAQVGSLRQFLQALSDQGLSNPLLVVTGGAADALSEDLGWENVRDPWLVFRGMLVD